MSTWLPVLVVLFAGLVGGWIASRRLRSEAASSSEAADSALRLADLERRRDSLYRQIRTSLEGPDRDRLELSAAYVLRQIDEMGGADDAPAALPAVEPDAEAEVGTPAAAPSRSARPMLAAFLSGAAVVALVGVLVYWALEDAQPRPDTGGLEPAAMPGEEHPSPPLSSEVQAEIDSLRRQVEANPNDVLPFKRLALALLTAESFMEAYEMAGEILAQFPNDPDGLYIQGMVRLTMGQDDEALSLLDRVLEQYPNHIMALAGRGMIFYRRNDPQAAVLIWQRALDAAGGSHFDLEQLLAMAAQASAQAAAAPPPVPASTAPAPVAVASDSYGIDVELAAGISVPPTATLFIFLRAEAQGPPAAVQRVQSPALPARFVLGPADTMLGRPLPDSGTITVRLDADGSASTRSEGDLEAQVQAAAGSSVRLVLGRS